MSELVWIAVPDGQVDGRLQLRVMVSPRLTTASLSEAGMAQWPPAALATAILLVEFSDGGGNAVGRVEIAPPHMSAETGVWERFFGPATLVKPVGQGDGRRLREVEVERSSEIGAAVDATYRAAAASMVTQDADRQPELEGAVLTQLETHWMDEPAAVRAPLRGPLPVPEPPDFHRIVAMLREHPNVLRSLGLIFDVLVPVTALPTGIADPRLRVLPLGQPPELPPIVSPWTRYDANFRPASSPNISGGMVTLTDDRDINRDSGWRVVTVDVENGAERLRQAARKAATAERSIAAAPVGLPALRSAGLMLVKKDRQADFAARRRASMDNALRAGVADAVLGSDDLLIGYRMDVRDRATKNWLSLHRRRALYRIGEEGDGIELGGGAIIEEGHLKANAAVDDGSGTLRANEVVARWDGWSLSVPRPPFDAPDRPERNRRRVDNTSHRFSWDFAVVEGSLPRLRFGHSYSLRARAAYLAGGGLELDDPAAERCLIDEVSYLRYEPILSPELKVPDVGATAGQLGPSETALEVVIRSDRGVTAAAFAAANPGYGLHPARELAPPRTSLAVAEQHGALDEVDGDEAWARIQEAIGDEPMEGGTEPALPDFVAQGVRVLVRREPGGLVAAASDRPWAGAWPKLLARRVELHERAAGDGVSPVAWKNVEGADRLVISLAPAEQATLEISSFPVADKISHFALQPVPGADIGAFTAGRHPLVTPAVAVTFTHAVRKPLVDPAGILAPGREENQTFAVLSPDPPLLGIDTRSTGQFDLRACWTEYDDDKQWPQADVAVQSVLIGRGDTGFATPLRHEFSDTKHRIVTYEGTAISRYRRYFGPDEDPADFLAKGTLSQMRVSIPSSARPQVPVVLSTRPSFLWEKVDEPTLGRTVRRRLAGRLRVELKRPWFTTGEGEMLAVVVWRDGVPPLSAQPFLSRVGLDPIWDTAVPMQWPRVADFVGVAGESESVRLTEIDTKVVAVPFGPFFRDGRWYADIAMPQIAASSYCPFIRLAVARYQPNSIYSSSRDLRLSQIVLTEMVQLLPDRELTVVRSADKVSVQLNGLAPQGARRNRVEVLIEQADDAASELTSLGAALDGVPGWRSLPDRTTQLELGGPAIDLRVPPGIGASRLRIREVELIGADDAIYPRVAGTSAELTERVVYLDTVPLG